MIPMLLLALLTCAALATSAAAGTKHHTRVAGTYTVTDFGTTGCSFPSESVLRCTTTGLKSTYSGSLEGTSTAEFTQTINCATKRTVGHGSETFVGSVNGTAGVTLKWRIVFASDFDCEIFYPSNFRGLGIVSQGGGLLRFGDTTYDGWLR